MADRRDLTSLIYALGDPVDLKHLQSKDHEDSLETFQINDA